MLVLDGCVQPSMAPAINAAAARVLDRLGVSLIRTPAAGCCGAVSHHLNAHEEGRQFVRRNIDAWWPELQSGAEAIVMTASGCGAMVKDYGHLLHDDPVYAEKAKRISDMTRDLAEIVACEDLASLQVDGAGKRVAYHPPCTLQHGQKLPGLVEGILVASGFELTPVPDKHLCCGSAGTYSILQKKLSQEFLAEKLTSLTSGAPETIVTANIGCQLHLQSGTELPVRHWVELLDSGTGSSKGGDTGGRSG
jgi:glycolate oxidase iron-sulfur subunit